MLVPCVAWGESPTGNDLKRWCDAKDSNLGLLCVVYLQGLVDGAQAGTANTIMHLIPRSPPAFGNAMADMIAAGGIWETQGICMEAAVTQGQIVDVVSMYLSNHPEKRHRPALSLFSEALEEAFPCE